MNFFWGGSPDLRDDSNVFPRFALDDLLRLMLWLVIRRVIECAAKQEIVCFIHSVLNWFLKVKDPSKETSLL